MIEDLRKLYGLLDDGQRRRLFGVLAIVIVAAGFQVVGVGSVLPFLEVVTNPQAVESGRLGWLYNQLSFDDPQIFLGVLGLGSLALIFVANVSLAVAHYVKQKFIYNFNHSLTMRLMSRYLGQDYEFFLDQNTSELNQRVLSEARHLAEQQVGPALGLLSRAAMAVALLAFLIYIDPVATLVLLGVVGGGFGLFYLAISRKMERLGEAYVNANQQRYQISDEAFTNIKNVKLIGKEGYFTDLLGPPSKELSDNLAIKNVYHKVPQYAIETLVFGGMLLVVAVFLLTGRPVLDIIPIMGVMAFAGYRLMPALRDLIKGMASFRFNEELMDRVRADLSGDTRDLTERTFQQEIPPIEPTQSIELRNLSYSYPNAHEKALDDVSIEIPVGDSVAVVGKTGAGKTTLIDVFLGLLQPDGGGLYVDGEEITDEHLPAWQKAIGYVPQQINLRDTTVEENIAFGIPYDDIDRERVQEAARAARIHDFVAEDLPDGYETKVGQQGIRLSGGQRQRIGIARALYRDPEVLVLDEATSDIDGATEAEITEAIRNLEGNMTVLIVAHRFKTIRGADQIYVLKDGEVVSVGDYDSLMASDKRFQALAQA